jgi:pimeloyl-ACP methyl ester carboxylesterase
MALHRWETGAGPALLCVHDTASTGDVWRPLADAAEERAHTIAYDRRGWGRSDAPEPYLRTTIQEQSEDAARLLEELGTSPALVCGAGLGAVVALDLIVRRPELVAGATLIEPPLLAFVPEATEVLSADGELVRAAFQRGGAAEAMDLYLSGTLAALGPGAERQPPELAALARERPMTLFAELAAVPAWDLPLAKLGAVDVPIAVVTATSTPQLVRTAGDALAQRLANARRHEIDAVGLPQLDSAAELAELVLEAGSS